MLGGGGSQMRYRQGNIRLFIYGRGVDILYKAPKVLLIIQILPPPLSFMKHVTTLEEQIIQHLQHLTTEQKKTVSNIIKTFAHANESRWNDTTFNTEINQKFAELKRGNAKGKE